MTMPGAIQTASPLLDEPGRRLAWVAPLALAIWIAVLLAFGFVLQLTAPPPPEPRPVEARIVEIPPPPAARLQGGPAEAPHPAAPPTAAKPRPLVKVHRRSVAVHSRILPNAEKAAPSVEKVAPKTLAPVEGAHRQPAAQPNAGAKSASTRSGAPGAATQEKAGSGGGAGPGSDSLGVRAIYSPAPEIPDDLREETFNTEAIAHFDVSYDGKVKVTLVKPTANPRLNEILLRTLRQWRFVPAMKAGLATDSSFDVRIPIIVQ
ncbi:MAG TPA: hypothetical protein VKT27_09700 [Candidatus Binataceae bacterium]|nr:hypothetical protein [Candidatus Binataceae bacterium]